MSRHGTYKGRNDDAQEKEKTLKLAKGYFGAKSKLFRTAKQAVMKSGQYAYIGRKQKSAISAVCGSPVSPRLRRSTA